MLSNNTYLIVPMSKLPTLIRSWPTWAKDYEMSRFFTS